MTKVIFIDVGHSLPEVGEVDVDGNLCPEKSPFSWVLQINHEDFLYR
jgi:hypothetical protein